MNRLVFVAVLAIVIAYVLSGCVEYKGDAGVQGIPGPAGIDGQDGVDAPTTTTTTLPPLQQDVNFLIDDENDYRLGLGQTMLAPGLSCTLYTVTGGDRIQSTIPGHNTLTGASQVATFLYGGLFNQPDSPATDGMNVLPAAIRPFYLNLFLLRCQGQLVVTDTDYYTFDLASDDASLLYIDGSKVIDNDNGHGVTLVSGQKYLRRGIHTFRLDYAETGAGNQALVLKMAGTSINPILYYH